MVDAAHGKKRKIGDVVTDAGKCSGGRDVVGFVVEKLFGLTSVRGDIVDYAPGEYRVVYRNGVEDKMLWSELRTILVPKPMRRTLVTAVGVPEDKAIIQERAVLASLNSKCQKDMIETQRITVATLKRSNAGYKDIIAGYKVAITALNRTIGAQRWTIEAHSYIIIALMK